VLPPGAEGRGSLVLDTSMREAELEVGEPYRARRDAVWNLTYQDFFVRGTR
jgi:hypothetical protein